MVKVCLQVLLDWHWYFCMSQFHHYLRRMKKPKYKYLLKIHNVMDYAELENLMNDYGSQGMRVTKVDDLGSVFEKNRPMRKYLLHLEQRIKKSK